MPCGGTQAAGPAGHPRHERVRKAPKQPAPQGTQDTSGPEGHPRSKEAQRPRRYLKTAALEASKEQVVVGASSLRPRKASKTRNGAEAKKKLSNPWKVFFARSSAICSSDSCGACCNSTPLAISAKRAVASCFALENLHALAKFGQFVLGDTGYRTRQTGASVNLRRDHIAGHPGCLDLLPLAQTFLRSRFWSRGLYRPLLSHHNIDKKTASVHKRGLATHRARLPSSPQQAQQAHEASSPSE